MTNNDEQMAALLSTNCRKHQDIAVYGEHGQRGCEDCVYTKQLITTTQAEAVRETQFKTAYALAKIYNNEPDKFGNNIDEYIYNLPLTNTKDAV